MTASEAKAMQSKQQNPTWRWLPLLTVASAMAIAFAMGWHKLLTFKSIGTNYDWLKTAIGENFWTALFTYMSIYIAVVALSLPGALIMTLAGGLLFGWKIGLPATVVAATIGATLLFLVAKTSFGEMAAERAGPWLAKLRDGFQDNAMSYLLFLRLVPAFPFVVVNLAPALLGVSLTTFVVATFFGIIPGTAAFSVAGAGLGSVVEAQNKVYQDCIAAHPASHARDCTYTIDTSAVLTKELIAAFVLLGLVALLPIAFKKFRGRYA